MEGAYFILLALIVLFIFRSLRPKKMVKAEILQKVQQLISSNHIFIASKTYCPYCQATLKTFEQLGTSPEVLQLNTIGDGGDIQDALAEITGQTTVPNIFIDGKHIGGNSDLQSLKSSGRLQRLLKL